MRDHMKIMQKYISAFFLASCVLAAVPSQAMDKFTTQIKDTVIANPYVSASILAGMVIGSCLYLKKRFFGRSVTVKPSIRQDVKLQETLVASAKEVTRPDQTLPVEQTVLAEPMKTLQSEPVCSIEHILADSQVIQTAKPEQISPVVDDNQVIQTIKVVNSHDQSLSIHVLNADDNDELQVSVPAHSNRFININ